MDLIVCHKRDPTLCKDIIEETLFLVHTREDSKIIKGHLKRKKEISVSLEILSSQKRGGVT